ncbi:hypothetical protein TREMEDRAFT_64159 [Tremella mesenterica DSM 1558]|uniref:uncharacterized protein n=1 Tax=Tremella mesenterica (strain ATCC 24925 / CBS 8224 / DSM 1558 / NBRC 9311 / NRRL Y-6157 / RJB 2259-6 / UBC 559-6) TaxID=578456 RepID=UPI0003F499AB|nr:uncharacterized protein TREMEDRAFT_64159 [Tremella mesenterica DSM 1558]EIW67568.1 hypothetical protein TREMEDRAFT_64159 [Tremella mesenterica DSM 1558]
MSHGDRGKVSCGVRKRNRGSRRGHGNGKEVRLLHSRNQVPVILTERRCDRQLPPSNWRRPSWGVNVSLGQGTRQGTMANFAVVIRRVVNDKMIVDELRLTSPYVTVAMKTRHPHGVAPSDHPPYVVKRDPSTLGSGGPGYWGATPPQAGTDVGMVVLSRVEYQSIKLCDDTEKYCRSITIPFEFDVYPPNTSSRQTRASTLAILPDVDPELLMRQTKRMRITSQATGFDQTPTADASRRALDAIKDRYHSGPSHDQQSSHLDDKIIEQYIDFKGGAGPSATGENPSPAKSVETEHGTVVENQNSPGNKSPVPPSDYSEGLVEVPNELETIFHAPRKVPVNDELVKALDARKDSEIGEIPIEFSTLWAKMTFSSVRTALKDEALDRFRETGAINPTVKWFRNALDRLAQGWRLRNKNGAVVRLEGNFKVFGENQQSRVQISRGIYLLPSNLIDVDVKGITVGAQTITSKVTFVLEHELCAVSARYRSLSSQDQSSSLTRLSGYIHLFTSLLLPLPSQHLGLYKSIHLISANYARLTPSETLDHLTSSGDPTVTRHTNQHMHDITVPNGTVILTTATKRPINWRLTLPPIAG